jgi:homoserine dehydrogenase
LGLTDDAILIRDIKKDDIIKLDDVDLNLPEDIVKAREYQYKTIK